MNDESKSVDHINSCFDSFLTQISDDPIEEQTFLLKDVLDDPNLLQAKTVDQLVNLSYRLKHFVDEYYFVNTKTVHMRRACREFIDQLRRYFVSPEMRKEIARGIKFRSSEKKRKYAEYKNCEIERAHACLKYRDAAPLLIELLQQTERLNATEKFRIAESLQSDLQCEQCGKGAGKHRRAGLILSDFMQAVHNKPPSSDK